MNRREGGGIIIVGMVCTAENSDLKISVKQTREGLEILSLSDLGKFFNLESSTGKEWKPYKSPLPLFCGTQAWGRTEIHILLMGIKI